MTILLTPKIQPNHMLVGRWLVHPSGGHGGTCNNTLVMSPAGKERTYGFKVERRSWCHGRRSGWGRGLAEMRRRSPSVFLAVPTCRGGPAPACGSSRLWMAMVVCSSARFARRKTKDDVMPGRNWAGGRLALDGSACGVSGGGRAAA